MPPVLPAARSTLWAGQTAHTQPDNLRVLTALIAASAQRAESAFGAISQGGGARRPFTHCDSSVYHVPVSAPVTELRAVWVLVP
jgi:hypothetical protein